VTGLEEFKRVISEYKNLSVWAAGASVVFPFIASFLSVIPPWPAGLNVITAVIQLGALIVIYQMYQRGAYRARRVVVVWSIIALLFVLAYMVLFTVLTIYVPSAKRSIVIGFQCLREAQQVYGDSCPWLGLRELSSVAFDEFVLWTKSSIAVARVTLIAVWFGIFISLAFMIGEFLVYQMKRTVSRPNRVRS
jgi:hypothetical protein